MVAMRLIFRFCSFMQVFAFSASATVDFTPTIRIFFARAIIFAIVTAILNLIDNSNYWLLHRPSARKIIIAAESTASDEVRLTVSDNGPGIRDAPELLVEPFYTRKPDGSGLGLYIVDRIMKAHRGRIEFLDKWTIPKGILEGANISLVFPPAEVKKE